MVIRLSTILQPHSAMVPVNRSDRAGSCFPITVRARNCIIKVVRVRNPYSRYSKRIPQNTQFPDYLVFSGSDKYHIRFIIQQQTYFPLIIRNSDVVPAVGVCLMHHICHHLAEYE